MDKGNIVNFPVDWPRGYRSGDKEYDALVHSLLSEGSENAVELVDELKRCALEMDRLAGEMQEAQKAMIKISLQINSAGRNLTVQNTMQPYDKAVYQLRIELTGIAEKIYRIIMVPNTLKFSKLHTVIQKAFGWQDYHLYEYQIAGALIGENDENDFDPIEYSYDTRKTPLRNMVGKKGEQFEYTYDFGDGWQHKITIEKILPWTDEAIVECIEGARNAPPEDCGGVPGYQEIIRELKKKPHSRDAELMTWLNGYDPERFEIGKVNAKLSKIKAPKK